MQRQMSMYLRNLNQQIKCIANIMKKVWLCVAPGNPVHYIHGSQFEIGADIDTKKILSAAARLLKRLFI